MGNKNSKAEGLQYEAKDWQETDKSVFYEVMKNNKGEQAYLYHFNIKDDFEIEDEVDIYHSRKSPANWVQVVGANLSSSGFGFCGSQENACVLTEPIPVLLNSIPRLNRQDSVVVLYNALKGYYDVCGLVIPAGITDRMIGFNRNGQTKVWVNENFGMNHPGHHQADATLDEPVLLNNLVNAVAPRVDLTPDFLNGVRNSRSIGNALNFIKANGGIPENILDANRINVTAYTGNQVTVLQDNTPLVPERPLVQSQPIHYPPPGPQVVQSGYRNPYVNFVYSPVVGNSQVAGTSSSFQTGYQVPVYNTTESIGTNKFSFTGAQ